MQTLTGSTLGLLVSAPDRIRLYEAWSTPCALLAGLVRIGSERRGFGFLRFGWGSEHSSIHPSRVKAAFEVQRDGD